jgi:hypothetical protein
MYAVLCIFKKRLSEADHEAHRILQLLTCKMAGHEQERGAKVRECNSDPALVAKERSHPSSYLVRMYVEDFGDKLLLYEKGKVDGGQRRVNQLSAGQSGLLENHLRSFWSCSIERVRCGCGNEGGGLFKQALIAPNQRSDAHAFWQTWRMSSCFYVDFCCGVFSASILFGCRQMVGSSYS